MIAAANVHRQLQRFDDALTDGLRRIRVGNVAQNDRELVAAQPSDRVSFLDA